MSMNAWVLLSVAQQLAGLLGLVLGKPSLDAVTGSQPLDPVTGSEVQ